MSPDRPHTRCPRPRMALGVGLTVAVLGCGGAFVYAQATGSSNSAEAQDATSHGAAESAETREALEALDPAEIDEDLALELADALDLAPWQLISAVNAVRAGQFHYGGEWDDTVSDRHRALADTLGLDHARTADAFGRVSNDDEPQSERRTRLVECLDEAVENGELSPAARADVLKVHDLGLLDAGS